MNRIRELREAGGLKQVDLARKMNCSVVTISRYETGKHEIDSIIIGQLCDLFGCTADYLLCRSDTPRASLSLEDAALIEAFHAAGAKEQSIVRALLDLDSAEIKEKLHA